eukprot:2726636-Prymnesium_polylepis.1
MLLAGGVTGCRGEYVCAHLVRVRGWDVLGGRHANLGKVCGGERCAAWLGRWRLHAFCVSEVVSSRRRDCRKHSPAETGRTARIELSCNRAPRVSSHRRS